MRPLLPKVSRRFAVSPFSAPVFPRFCRSFSVSVAHHTDGVFRKLTEMAVPTPWIDALRAKQATDEKQTAPAPTQPAEVTPKRMSDSYVSFVLPLAGDKYLSDTYLNSQGNLRLGALFMDLDALSGVVAYRHTGGQVMTVTAAFDRISLRGSMAELCDLELSGQVRHVGKSSIDIGLQVRKLDGKGDEILLSCSCTMVSLDPATKKPVKINPLIVETPEERTVNELASKESDRRKELRKKSLLKHTPNAEETGIIHKLWQKQIQWHGKYNHFRCFQ
jgi:acyl-coenzyme A thioesterase 9